MRDWRRDVLGRGALLRLRPGEVVRLGERVAVLGVDRSALSQKAVARRLA